MKRKKKTKLEELRERSPWRTAAERKGRGRKQGKGAAGSSWNSPISPKLNKQRAESNALEFQLIRTFG
jgi:hypothetical protein